MHHLKNRINDWLHERRIARLRKAMLRSLSIETWKAFREAVMQRSATQVARMEREKGLV